MDYLGNLRVVRTWACKQYELRQADLELLFKLHAIRYFTWGDFIDGSILLNWDKKRWYRLKNDGWIKVKRAKQGKHKRYNLYCLTSKSTRIVNQIYRILNGEEPIPTAILKNSKNRISSYSDKVTASAIKVFNKRLKQEQDAKTQQSSQ